MKALPLSKIALVLLLCLVCLLAGKKLGSAPNLSPIEELEISGMVVQPSGTVRPAIGLRI